MSDREKIKIMRVVVGLNLGGVQQMILNLFKGLDNGRFEPVNLAIENTGATGAESEKEGPYVSNFRSRRSTRKVVMKKVYKYF